jgi:hypothetical protein
MLDDLVIDSTHQSANCEFVHLWSDCPGLNAAYQRLDKKTNVCMHGRRDFRKKLADTFWLKAKLTRMRPCQPSQREMEAVAVAGSPALVASNVFQPVAVTRRAVTPQSQLNVRACE